MKKFILAMTSLSLLAGCGSYWVVNLSEEAVTVNGNNMTETCEEVSYSFWGLFGDWPLEVKVGEEGAETLDDKKDYTVHPDGEIKEATEKEVAQCTTQPATETALEEESDAAQKAAKAATDAAAALNTKVEEYKAAQANTVAQNPGNSNANAETQATAQVAEEAALAAAQEAAQVAVDAAAAARTAAIQKEVSDEDKTAANTAATAAEEAVEAAKAAGVAVEEVTHPTS